MQPNNNDETLEALRDIRSIMDRSTRFISLSGWTGIWAGATALVGAAIAYSWLQKPAYEDIGTTIYASAEHFDGEMLRFILLGIAVFVVATAGAVYFTWRKAQKQGQKIWNNASRMMLEQLFYPVFAGGVFSLLFIYHGCGMFVAPTCLVFYGLSLISASRHMVSEIRYLGMLDVALGCASMFQPGFGLFFWAMGFGVLHILYGAIMWSKYDK